MSGGGGDRGERGMTDLVGVILLISLTIVGAIAVVVIGTVALQSIADRTQDDLAADSMREMRSRLSSVADASVDASTTFSFTDDVATDVQVEAAGRVTIAATNGSIDAIPADPAGQVAASSVYTPGEQTLGTLVYRRSDGSLMAYQGGGLWSVDGETTRPVEPPGLDYDGVTLDFSLINVTRAADVAGDGTVVATHDVTRSRQAARQLRTALEGAWTNGTGTVPVNVTVTIRSPYADGWADYARSGMTHAPDEVTYWPSNDTVRLEFHAVGSATNGGGAAGGGGDGGDGEGDGADCGDEADENRGHGNDCGLDEDNPGEGEPPGQTEFDTALAYDPASNALQVNQNSGELTLLTAQVGETVEREVVEEPDDREPLDVVFAIDETGSMWENDPGNERLNQTRNFLESLNATHGDRAGFVQFTTFDETRCDVYDPDATGFPYDGCDSGVGLSSFDGIANHHALTGDLDAVRAALVDWRTGGTDVSTGIEHGVAVVENAPGRGNNRTLIVLSDGRNSDPAYDPQTVDWARRANEDHNVTVHAIGLTEDADEELLRDVAAAGGGSYHFAADAHDLAGAFEQVESDVRTERRRRIERTSTTLTARQAVATDVTIAGQSNVNDPATFGADGGDAQTMTISNLEPGGKLSFSLALAECDTYEPRGEPRVDGAGDTYQPQYCTDAGSTTTVIDNSSVSDHRIFRDGDSTGGLSGLASEWWQADPAAVVDAYTTGSRFDLPATEAIVALDVDDPATGQAGYVLLHVAVDELPDPDEGGDADDDDDGDGGGGVTGGESGSDPIAIGYSELILS